MDKKKNAQTLWRSTPEDYFAGSDLDDIAEGFSTWAMGRVRVDIKKSFLTFLMLFK